MEHVSHKFLVMNLVLLIDRMTLVHDQKHNVTFLIVQWESFTGEGDKTRQTETVGQNN